MKPTFIITTSTLQLFTDEVIEKNSAFLGEQNTQVRAALQLLVPTVLYGLAEKSTSWYGLKEVSQRASDVYHQGVLQKLAVMLCEGNGSYLFLLTSMFGNRSNFIISQIASFSKVKPCSANSLTSLALFAALGLIGQHKANTNISETGLAALLLSEKNIQVSMIPPGLDLIEPEEELTATIDTINNGKRYSKGWMAGVAGIIGLLFFWGWLFINRKENNALMVIKNGKDSVHNVSQKITRPMQ